MIIIFLLLYACIEYWNDYRYRLPGISVPFKSLPFWATGTRILASDIWTGPGLRTYYEINSNIIHRVCITSATAIRRRSDVSFIFIADGNFF